MMGTFDGMTLSEAREALATLYKLKLVEDPCWAPKGAVARWLWGRYLPETIKGRRRPPSATRRLSSAEWNEVRPHVLRARAVAEEVAALTGVPLEIKYRALADNPWMRWIVEIRGDVKSCEIRLNEWQPESIGFLAWCYTVSLPGAATRAGRASILQTLMRHRHPFHHMWSLAVDKDENLCLFWLGDGLESSMVCPYSGTFYSDTGEVAEMVEAALAAVIDEHGYRWSHANVSASEAA